MIDLIALTWISPGVAALAWIVPLVIVLAVTIGSIVFVSLLKRPMVEQAREQEAVMQTGIDAQGKILKIWDTGVTINMDPEIGMTVEVNAADGTFQADTAALVSRLLISSYQPGALVTVKYDPTDKTKVVVTGTVPRPVV